MEILGGLDEADGVAAGFAEEVVAGHPQRLGEDEGGDAMPVHRPLAEVAAAGRRLHPAEEVIEATGDGFLVAPLEVGAPCPEERQQRDCRACRRARERAGIAAGTLTAAAIEVEAPRSVVGLMERQPCQAPFDGGFARRASPFAPYCAPRKMPLILSRSFLSVSRSFPSALYSP